MLDAQQKQFAAAIRSQQANAAVGGISDTRMAVYQSLFLKNIAGFIRSGFPVLRRVLNETQWWDLVHAFLAQHRCQTPLFPEIAREFVEFLQATELGAEWPRWLCELAHYEWLEIAVDTAMEEVEVVTVFRLSLDSCLVINPTVRLQGYEYPVHRISASNQAVAPEATWLAVYRDSSDAVKFLSLNALSFELLRQLQLHPALTGGTLLTSMAQALGANVAQWQQHGLAQLQQFVDSGIVSALRQAAPLVE